MERSNPLVAARTSSADNGAAAPVAEADRAVRAGPDVPRPKVDPQALRRIHMFEDLADADLAWIGANSERLDLEPGEVFMHPGQPAESMFLVFNGVLQGRREQLGPNAPAFTVRAGEVNGAVPFSRMTVFSGTGRAVTRATVGLFPRSLFPELLRRVPVLVQRFVVLLLDRVRDSTRRDAQFEKLSALGKLSAGLAHELNNPAAAVMRATSDANLRINERGQITAALIEGGVTAESVRRLDALRGDALVRLHAASAAAKSGQSVASATLDRSDREDALAIWLRDVIGTPDPYASAPVFVGCGDRANRTRGCPVGHSNGCTRGGLALARDGDRGAELLLPSGSRDAPDHAAARGAPDLHQPRSDAREWWTSISARASTAPSRCSKGARAARA